MSARPLNAGASSVSLVNSDERDTDATSMASFPIRILFLIMSIFSTITNSAAQMDCTLGNSNESFEQLTNGPTPKRGDQVPLENLKRGDVVVHPTYGIVKMDYLNPDTGITLQTLNNGHSIILPNTGPYGRASFLARTKKSQPGPLLLDSIILRYFRENMHAVATDGPYLQLGDLRNGQIIAHEKHGIIEVQSTDPTANQIRFRIVGEFRSKVTGYGNPFTLIKDSSKYALIGSPAGWSILNNHIHQYFNHPENIPLLFAADALHRRFLGTQAMKLDPKNIRGIPTFRRYEGIFKGLFPEDDFRVFWTVFSEDLSSKSPKLDKTQIEKFKLFAAKIYEVTGEDLVRSSVLGVSDRHWTKSNFTWPVLIYDAGVIARGSALPLLGGRGIVNISPIVDQYYRTLLWKDGIASLGVPSTNRTSHGLPLSLAAGDYIPQSDSRHSADPFSQELASFKRTPSADWANTLVARNKTRIQTLAPEGIDLIIPVPSGGGGPLVLAEALSQSLGAPVESYLRFQNSRAPQIFQETLFDRIENTGGSLTLDPQQSRYLIGKKVLIVDDIRASGVTLQEAVRSAYDAGAHTVYVFTAGATP